MNGSDIRGIEALMHDISVSVSILKEILDEMKLDDVVDDSKVDEALQLLEKIDDRR